MAVKKLTNVMSLTGNGLRDWLVQRVTSLILTAYSLFLLGYIMLHAGLDYSTWQGLFSHTGMRVFTVLSLLSLAWHVWIGMWTIATDYIKPTAIRLAFEIMVIIALFACVIWGIAILWGI